MHHTLPPNPTQHPLEALFVQMDDALCWIWQRRVRGLSTITVVNQSYANFYEKALFVKVDLAAALWRKQLLFALRAMLLFALPGSLLGSSVHYEIRLFEPKALQSSERSLLEDGPSSLAQSPSEIRSAFGRDRP